MSALDAIADWPVPTVAAAVVGPSGVLATARRHPAPVRAGVGDQAAGRPRRAGRDRGGRRRTRHRGRPARVDGAPPARPHGGLCDALGGGDRRARASGGSTPTTASRVLAETIERERRASSSAHYLTEAVFEPLGMADTTLDGGAEAAGYGATSTVDRPGGLRRRPAAARDGVASRCTPRPRPCSSRA